MIFNEIYSAYYNAVAKIISTVIDGNTDSKVLDRIVAENAFGESMFSIIPALKSGKWQLINPDMTTQIKHPMIFVLSSIPNSYIIVYGIQINTKQN